MFKLKTSPGFEKRSPIFKAWLDAKMEEAQQLSEKVERMNVPRGEVYPLSRPKVLFALSQVAKYNLKFNLKSLADSLKVPYGTVRHWVNDNRIKEKTKEFKEEFVDEVLRRSMLGLQCKMMDESHGWPPVGDTLDILKEEIKSFRGPILHSFIKKLSALLRSTPEMESLFRPFCNDLFQYIRPHNAVHFRQLYELSAQLGQKEIRENFHRLNDHIEKGEKQLALEKSEECESDTLSYLNHHNEMSQKYWDARSHLDFLMQANTREFKKWREERRRKKLPPHLRELEKVKKGAKVKIEL